ncbi:MAG: 23S rRNA (uracil(1939)-C(5))-methyltransferase RlmD, partial [Oscillospiraceae bacterium]
HPDLVILDPPRKGCDASLIGTIARLNPSRVVMVSCDSATAARDAALFSRRGYAACRVQAVDLFPRTDHVECVMLLNKRSDTTIE